MNINEFITSFLAIKAQFQENLNTLAIIIFIPWMIYFISRLIPAILLLGIIPRTLRGLPGILFSPLLHADFNHIFFNSIPLFVLSGFVLVNGLQLYITITLFITILCGLAVWCFGNKGIHIGASGLITGYWGFLIADIYTKATPTTIILGILSAYYFAGIFLGIFPREKGVSWQGHLFGLLAGLATSFFINKGYYL